MINNSIITRVDIPAYLFYNKSVGKMNDKMENGSEHGEVYRSLFV